MYVYLYVRYVLPILPSPPISNPHLKPNTPTTQTAISPRPTTPTHNSTHTPHHANSSGGSARRRCARSPPRSRRTSRSTRFTKGVTCGACLGGALYTSRFLRSRQSTNDQPVYRLTDPPRPPTHTTTNTSSNTENQQQTNAGRASPARASRGSAWTCSGAASLRWSRRCGGPCVDFVYTYYICGCNWQHEGQGVLKKRSAYIEPPLSRQPTPKHTIPQNPQT